MNGTSGGKGATSIARILGLSFILVTLIPFLPLGYFVWTGYRGEILRLESEIQATNHQVALLAAGYLDSLVREIREGTLRAAAGPAGDLQPPPGPSVVRWEVVGEGCRVHLSQVSPSRMGAGCGYGRFAESLVEAEVRISRIGTWIEGRPPTVLFGIRGGGSTSLVGVLSPEDLHERTTALTGEVLDRHVYLVDETGQLIFYSDLGLSNQGRDLTDNPPIRKFLDGLQGPLRFESVVSGKERLGFVRKLPETGWGVIVSADIGSRLLDVRDRYKVFAWSILFAMMAALAILLWVSRILVHPLLQIRDALAAEGRLDGSPLAVPGQVREIAEYDRLVEAYNELSLRFSTTEKELIQAEKSAMLGQLASGIAHEIGTPLGVISGNAQYLMRKLDHDDPTASGLRMIVKHVERITSLVQRLLDFSRPTEVKLAPVDVGEIVDRTLEMTAGMTTKLHVAIDHAPGTPKVMGDPKLLEHALLNLIVNASQATPEGGRLSVQVGLHDGAASHGDDGSWVFVRIADTGCGIPPENLGRVFQPFFTTKAQGKGTGLGLAIVERIVRQHGGHVDVSSRQGEGSVFTMRIRPSRPEKGGSDERE